MKFAAMTYIYNSYTWALGDPPGLISTHIHGRVYIPFKLAIVAAGQWHSVFDIGRNDSDKSMELK